MYPVGLFVETGQNHVVRHKCNIKKNICNNREENVT